MCFFTILGGALKIDRFLRELRDKLGRRARVGFYGIGASNLSLISQLTDDISSVVLRSDKKLDWLPKIPYPTCVLTGDSARHNFSEDVIFFSPSVRRERLTEISRDTVLLSDAELYFLECTAPTLAVTGSDGKSTTATLAGLILNKSGRDAVLLGNIGTPFAEAVGGKICVAELSSFQLRYTSGHTEAAAITSLTPNHLDWHASFSEYRDAKLSLLRSAERAVIPLDGPGCLELLPDISPYIAVSARHSLKEARSLAHAEHYLTVGGGFILRDGVPLIPISLLRRREWYNIINFMLALALTDGKYTEGGVILAANEFVGLEHRAELFFTHGGIDYINSSIDSTPARCSATLSALGRRVHVILGGRSKGVPITEAIPALTTYSASISLYGEAGEEYFTELKNSDALSDVDVTYFPHFPDAVDNAVRSAKTGEAVLLSPAATSYGEFNNFAERGKFFKDYIKRRLQTDRG